MGCSYLDTVPHPHGTVLVSSLRAVEYAVCILPPLWFKSVKSTRPLLLALAVFAAANVAYAEPTAADRATARQLMLEGRNLRHDKDLKGALEKFRAADALMGVPTTGLELARTQAELGLFVEALDSCARVIRHPVTPGEPAPFAEARREARELREELRRRTPYLRFIFPPNADAAGVELRVDGVVIPSAARHVPRLVDPGRHQVELIAGSQRQQLEVIVEEGEARQVALRVQPADRPEPRPAPAHDDGPNLWLWGGFTTAAAGGVIGGVTGALAWSERNQLDNACPDRRCAPDEMERLDRARGIANVSTYAFILGGVGAAVGIGAVLSSGSDTPHADAGARIVPCTAGTLCLNGVF